MKTQARVVVIGGGVVGVGTLYHLAKKGWSDVVLVERRELTSGSTWHAAGLLPLFNMSYSVGQIHKYSVALYRTLEEETGQNVGLRLVGNIRLAMNRDRMDEYRQYAGVARTIGVDVDFLTPDEVKEIWPLCNIDGLVGAIRHPGDGVRAAGGPDPGARDRRAQPGRGNPSQHDGSRDIPHRRRRVVRAHRPGRRRLRARGQRDRQLRPADRGNGGPRRPGHPCPAPVHRDRAAPGDSGAARGGASRDGGAARIRRVLVPARGAGWSDPRPLRDRRSGVLRGRPRRGLRVRAVPGGPRASRAAHRGRHQPRAGVRRSGRQAGLQRRDLLHPRRQPDHRARLGASTTSGSTRDTASGLPRRAAPASSSRNGSSRASRPST